MGTKIVIERDYIIDEELDSIDFDLNKELKIDYDDVDEMHNVSNADGKYWTGDSHPIKIDRVLKVLNKYKNKYNCKYVEIMYHEDHISYIFNGLNIYKHKEGSKKYKEYTAIDEEEVERQKREKITKLENELKHLKGD
jgi:hypothetical protein